MTWGEDEMQPIRTRLAVIPTLTLLSNLALIPILTFASTLGLMFCTPTLAEPPALPAEEERRDEKELRAERELFTAINRARREQGLQTLRWNNSLAAAARYHATQMAEHRAAQHAFEGEPTLSARVRQTGARFTWLAENVTQGPAPEFIHAQFMQSHNHRANILDPDMNSIGIGIVESQGQLFTVEDFAQLR